MDSIKHNIIFCEFALYLREICHACLDSYLFNRQVDIFLRRAFFGTQQKVHCLAFADSLDYDVGEKAEKKIKEYVNSAGLTKVIYSLSMSDICIDDIDGKLLDV